jgi:DNA mismatch repair protein MutS2
VEKGKQTKVEVTVQKTSTTEAQGAPRTAIAELHVRGFRVEEALEKVDKFLDESVLAGHAEVRIIHGIGTGALKKALAEFLAQHPHVETTREAEREHGGPGVTVVALRRG